MSSETFNVTYAVNQGQIAGVSTKVLANTDVNIESPTISMSNITPGKGHLGGDPSEVDCTLESVAAHEFGHADYLCSLLKQSLTTHRLGGIGDSFDFDASNARALDFSNAYRAAKGMRREDWHDYRKIPVSEQRAR
jgi:hypothetical protein